MQSVSIQYASILFQVAHILRRTGTSIFMLKPTRDWLTKSNRYSKLNISKIFDDIFKNQQFTAKDSNQLRKFISIFIFSYLDSYITIQLNAQLNYKLQSENSIIKNANNTLSSIVDGILQSNVELGNVINNYYNLCTKHSSFVDNGYSMTFVGDDNANNCQSFVGASTDVNVYNSRIPKKRILTVISKKNNDVLKELREKNSNKDVSNPTENPSPTGLNLVNHLKENNNNVIFSNKQSVL